MSTTLTTTPPPPSTSAASRKRIILATPVRDSLLIPYVQGLWDVAIAVATPAHPLSAYDIIPIFASSPYVNSSRNDLVERAYDLDFSEIVFIDSDVGFSAASLARLLSHDTDIVGGSYARRTPANPPIWAHHLLPPNTNHQQSVAVEGSDVASASSSAPSSAPPNLLPASVLPAGFLRITRRVFDAIRTSHPDRLFHTHAAPSRLRTEFFPIGLLGPYTPSGRLASLHHLLSRHESTQSSSIPIHAIREAISFSDASSAPALPHGEDAFFFHLAASSTPHFTPFLDPSLILPHYGLIAFPAIQICQ